MAIKPGDLVIIVGGAINPPQFEYLRHEVFEVIKPSRFDDKDWEIHGPTGLDVHSEERHLQKLPPQNELTTWENCIWKPNKVLI